MIALPEIKEFMGSKRWKRLCTLPVEMCKRYREKSREKCNDSENGTSVFESPQIQKGTT